MRRVGAAPRRRRRVGKIAGARCPRGCVEQAISPTPTQLIRLRAANLLENHAAIRKCRHSPRLRGIKCESWRRCHKYGSRASNKEQKKTLVRSEGWLAPDESLEFAQRDELKKLKLAHQGRQAL